MSVVTQMTTNAKDLFLVDCLFLLTSSWLSGSF